MMSLAEIRARAAAGTTRPLPYQLPRTPGKAEFRLPAGAALEPSSDDDFPRVRKPKSARHRKPKSARHRKPKKKPKGSVAPQVKRRLIYAERNRVLRSLGFPTYSAYLESDTWRRIRAEVLGGRPRCMVCDGRANQVHHTSYSKRVMVGQDLEGLVPLCGDCHQRIEFRDRDGEKLNTEQATAKLKSLKIEEAKKRAAERRAAEERLKDQVVALLLS